MQITNKNSEDPCELKMRVFVSSVQDELINERTAILELINTDPFLSKYIEAVLFEH